MNIGRLDLELPGSHVSSAETNGRLGGILAIDELIDMQCEESETKTMVLRSA